MRTHRGAESVRTSRAGSAPGIPASTGPATTTPRRTAHGTRHTAHGEYRTKNLILAEYDRMAAVGLTLENPFVEGESGTYRSTLTPPLATAPDTAPDSRNLAPARDSAGPATVPGPALQELGVT